MTVEAYSEVTAVLAAVSGLRPVLRHLERVKLETTDQVKISGFRGSDTWQLEVEFPLSLHEVQLKMSQLAELIRSNPEYTFHSLGRNSVTFRVVP